MEKQKVLRKKNQFIHTCEPSGRSIFLPILRVPPVNFQNLDLHFAINISGNSPFGTPALTKNAEIRMVKVNVIFNDIHLLICLTPLQVNWVMVIN